MNASTKYGFSAVGIIALALLGVGAFFVSEAHAGTLAISTIGSGTYINANDVATSIQVTGTADAPGDGVTVTLTDGTNIVSGSTLADPITGSFSVTIDGPSQLANLVDGTITSSIEDTTDSNTVDGPTVTKVTVAPPAPVIETSPSDPSNSLSYTITFDTEPGLTYQCALDGDPLADCSSGTFSGTTNAITHLVHIQAVDAAGNTTETDYSWTITIPTVTTEVPSDITASDATMNGLVGSNDAAQVSFWVSQSSPIDTSNPNNIPTGVDSTPVTFSVPANGTFTDQLSLVTTSGIPGNLEPLITPNTTYYYVAWANVGGTWYPGVEQTVTTLSSDDTLSDLSVDQGDNLSPAFGSGTTAYTDDVDNSVTDLNVTPTTNDAGATVSVNGNTIASGTPSDVSLNIGDNMITVHVVASDGTNQDYTIDVTRDFSDLTNLNAELTVAEADISGATPGSTVGDYPQMSIDTLNAAITAAETVTDTNDQSTVDAATATLTDAVTTFEATQVQFIAVTGLQLSESSNTLNVSDTDPLVPTIAPLDATDQTVTYQSSDTSVATVDANTGVITAVAPGTATITATADDTSIGTFTATDDITVNKIAQTITFGSIADQTYGDADVILGATSDSGLSVSYEISGVGCTASSTNSSAVEIMNPGTCAVVASQSGDATYQAATPVTQNFTVNPRPITVTATTDTKAYDGTTISAQLPTITSGSIAQNSETFDTYSLSQTFSNSGPGTGITITPVIQINGYVQGSNDPDYTVIYVTATGNITGAPITITADPQTVVYGQTDPALTYKVTSGTLLSGHPLAGALTREAGESVDTYGIEQGTLTDINNADYDITFVPANFVVTPAPLTITANNESKTVGDTFTFAGTEFTPTGLMNGETVGSVTLTSAGADPSATVAGSPYIIVPSAATGGTFDSDNYDITYVNGTLTVNPVPAPAASSGGGGNGPIVGGGSAPTALPNNGGAPSGQVLGASAYNFAVNFGLGTQDNDVTQLQLILISDGYLKIGSPTGYFGQATFAGVKLYQSANGISPVSGYVGPKTRAVLNGGTIPASADEQTSLQIQELQQELHALLAQIAAMGATSSTTTSAN